jgi:Glyoxalase/Bleomycin resistance protein/Dioxygenase superfamily
MIQLEVVVDDLVAAARAHAAIYGIERWRAAGDGTVTGSDAQGVTFRLVQGSGVSGEGIRGITRQVAVAGGEERRFDVRVPEPAPGVVHAGVVVRDLEAGMAEYAHRFGPLEWRRTELRPERATLDGRPVEHELRLARADIGGFEIELIGPGVGPTHYDRFGEGVHHLLLWPALDEAQWAGLRGWMASMDVPVAQSGRAPSGAEYFYLDTRRMLGGYLVEAICRPGRA